MASENDATAAENVAKLLRWIIDFFKREETRCFACGKRNAPGGGHYRKGYGVACSEECAARYWQETQW